LGLLRRGKENAGLDRFGRESVGLFEKRQRNDSHENMTKRLIAAFKSVRLTIPNDFKKGCKDGTMIQIWKEMPEIIDY